MAADASAYAALGLEPGADPASIERAYRRLIKQHHPDREGGDPERAAEINRAYRDIRAERHLKDPLELNDDWIGEQQSGRWWFAFVFFLAAATIVLLLAQGPLAPLTDGLASPGVPPSTANRSASRAASSDPMDQPLHVAAIDAAVRDALRLARTGDEMALARTSRECHHSLRTDPSLPQLDRCAAFDDAVVQFQDRDPLRDQGPFGELAVTGRIWSGASALSDDSVAIDGRLGRIRLRTEVTLAPAIQSAPAKHD